MRYRRYGRSNRFTFRARLARELRWHWRDHAAPAITKGIILVGLIFAIVH